MTPEQLKERTKRFALRIMRLTESLPRGRTGDTVGRQLLRSGMSVGANYRAACRARSTADFVAKMGLVEEEADEALFWMELLVASELVKEEMVADLMEECDQITAIVVSSINTARSSKRKERNK
jgi:four helix bundle protein